MTSRNLLLALVLLMLGLAGADAALDATSGIDEVQTMEGGLARPPD